MAADTSIDMSLWQGRTDPEPIVTVGTSVLSR